MQNKVSPQIKFEKFQQLSEMEIIDKDLLFLF